MHRIGLLLIGQPGNGGSYQFWLSVMKALSQLDRNKYEVQIYSKYEGWIELAKEMSLNYVRLCEKRSVAGKCCERVYRRFPNIFFRFLTIKLDLDYSLIQKKRPDLLFTQIVDGAGDVLQIPSVVPILDLMHRYESHFAEVAKEYDARESLYSHQCQIAEILLADSEVGKRHIIESYGEVRKDLEKHVEVLPFVPPDYIYHAKKIDGLPYEIFPKYIFYPAQFWTHKNHSNLIEALTQLKKKGVIVNLVLVGSEQNNKQTIEKKIQENRLQDQIKILGYVTNEEMVYLYQHARALVMPTFFGPTNIPQLEAFELGCPVATSAIYGIPEQVGNAALLFDPNSVDEIAKCIEKLWVDDTLCNELIDRGKKRAECWGQKQFACKINNIIDKYFEMRDMS